MARAKSNQGGRPAEVGRFFRGLPVIDAEEPLRIVINKADIRMGRRLDPNNCVFAQACRRLFNSHAVAFLRRYAYVELPDAKGKRVVNRFRISLQTAELIHNFDKTGECPEGGFVLSAPSPCNTLGAHRAYAKQYQRDVFYGKREPKRRKPNKRYLKTMEGVRDGRGKLGINYAL